VTQTVEPKNKALLLDAMKRFMHALDLYAAAIATALLAVAVVSSRVDEAGSAINIRDSDIGGVVTGPSGPEAGVWVIAETRDLATKFARVVVTDERGRYVVPDLPKANYRLWVRCYGLVDSAKVQSSPGNLVNLSMTARSVAGGTGLARSPMYVSAGQCACVNVSTGLPSRSNQTARSGV